MSQPNSRRFQLHRDEDETGVSGTGIVAEGIEFTSGKVALTWLTEHGCVNVYDTIKTVVELHGHHGKTRLAYLDADLSLPCEEVTPPKPRRRRKPTPAA